MKAAITAAERGHEVVLYEKSDVHAKVVTNTVGQLVTGEGLVVRNQEGKEVLLRADTVINAVGYCADHILFRELCDAAPIVQMVGDCRKPGKVTNAVSDGYYIALDI